MKTQPIKDFLAATKLYEEGMKEQSLETVSQAMGSEVPLEKLANSLEKVFIVGTPLNEIVLQLTLSRTR